jgi:hypothetical protein
LPIKEFGFLTNKANRPEVQFGDGTKNVIEGLAIKYH